MESSRGFGSFSIFMNRVRWRFTPVLVLSGGVSPNCARDGINRPFIIRSKSLSSMSKCVLLVTLRWAHLIALDMAASQERRW